MHTIPHPKNKAEQEARGSRWAIQYIDLYDSEPEADQALLALAEQDGFIAGRTYSTTKVSVGGRLYGGAAKPWKLQAFFEGGPEAAEPSNRGRLPDNCRWVLLLPGMPESLMRKG